VILRWLRLICHPLISRIAQFISFAFLYPLYMKTADGSLALESTPVTCIKILVVYDGEIFIYSITIILRQLQIVQLLFQIGIDRQNAEQNGFVWQALDVQPCYYISLTWRHVIMQCIFSSNQYSSVCAYWLRSNIRRAWLELHDWKRQFAGHFD
jgi:hypothetical protein